MLFGPLRAAAHNIARQQRDLRLFETGRVYGWRDGRSMETERIALLITGRRWKESWRADDRRAVVEDLREEVEILLELFGVNDAHYEPTGTPLLSDAVSVSQGGRTFATIGAVERKVTAHFDLGQPCFFAEIDSSALRSALEQNRITYAEPPRFPSVRRDLSLLIDRSVTFAQLDVLARKSERELLRRVDLFDVYEGDKLPAGKKSYALAFTLQHPDRTLTDEQVEKAMGRIRSAFERETGAVLRS